MQTWAYPAVIERHAADDFVVTFPDVPEAITGGSSIEEARLNAIDALEEAILAYMAEGRALPVLRAAKRGEEIVILDPVTATRAALSEAMREMKITNVALAKTLGKSEGAVRRLTDGRTGVKVDTVLQALTALGRRTALAVVSV